MVDVVPDMPHQFRQSEPASDPEAAGRSGGRSRALDFELQEAGDHRRRGNSSLRPARRSAGAWPKARNIAIAATMLGKSVISEVHPLYVGLYEGAMGRDEVTRFVEESDCVILLGTFMTDINLGIYTAKLDPAKCIYATSEQLRIRHHHYHDVLLADFIRELAADGPQPPRASAAAAAASRTAKSSCCVPRLPSRSRRLMAG